jgi:glutaredoxin
VSTEVIIHSKDGCPFCDEARAFMTGNAVPFTEVKHNDPAARAAMYDGFGLTGTQRTVPQVVVMDDGEAYRIGGAQALRISGIGSLFHRQAVGAPVAVSARAEPVNGVYVADEGHPCCE